MHDEPNLMCSKLLATCYARHCIPLVPISERSRSADVGSTRPAYEDEEVRPWCDLDSRGARTAPPPARSQLAVVGPPVETRSHKPAAATPREQPEVCKPAPDARQ